MSDGIGGSWSSELIPTFNVLGSGGEGAATLQAELEPIIATNLRFEIDRAREAVKIGGDYHQSHVAPALRVLDAHSRDGSTEELSILQYNYAVYLCSIGVASGDRDKLEESAAFFMRAYDSAIECGEHRLRARSVHNYGFAKYVIADSYYDEECMRGAASGFGLAVSAWYAVGDDEREACARKNLALALGTLGLFDGKPGEVRAMNAFDEAIKAFRRVGDSSGQWGVVVAKAECLQSYYEHGAAADLFMEAIARLPGADEAGGALSNRGCTGRYLLLRYFFSCDGRDLLGAIDGFYRLEMECRGRDEHLRAIALLGKGRALAEWKAATCISEITSLFTEAGELFRVLGDEGGWAESSFHRLAVWIPSKLGVAPPTLRSAIDLIVRVGKVFDRGRDTAGRAHLREWHADALRDLNDCEGRDDDFARIIQLYNEAAGLYRKSNLLKRRAMVLRHKASCQGTLALYTKGAALKKAVADAFGVASEAFREAGLAEEREDALRRQADWWRIWSVVVGPPLEVDVVGPRLPMRQGGCLSPVSEVDKNSKDGVVLNLEVLRYGGETNSGVGDNAIVDDVGPLANIDASSDFEVTVARAQAGVAEVAAKLQVRLDQARQFMPTETADREALVREVEQALELGVLILVDGMSTTQLRLKRGRSLSWRVGSSDSRGFVKHHVEVKSPSMNPPQMPANEPDM